MSYAHEAKSRLDRKREGQESDPFVDLMYDLKLAKADFECAAALVSSYKTSTSEAIKLSAGAAEQSFTQLADLQSETVADLNHVLNAGEREIPKGTLIERRAQRAVSADNAWKLIPQAAIAATYSVVEEDKETKLMSRLALTKTQQDEILRRLRALSGDDVTNGIRAGQHSLVAAASVLYEVVGKQGRKTRDAK
jgi:hypothetical protein